MMIARRCLRRCWRAIVFKDGLHHHDLMQAFYYIHLGGLQQGCLFIYPKWVNLQLNSVY